MQKTAIREAKTNTRSHSSVFMTMALDMTWRLAVVVLLPVIGGFKLDEALGSSPVFIITGFGLAMAGTAYVMWQTLQTANKLPVPKIKYKNPPPEDDD